jgi:L-aminopeptidase/D-esterase-like protein
VIEGRGLPAGFLVGHNTDRRARTGCTAFIAPPGARAGCDVRGGGPGTREIDVIGPLASGGGITGLMFAGGSAHGLAAADGAVRYLEQNGRGYKTPLGLVPIVPAAVIYDQSVERIGERPSAEAGYVACSAASDEVPETGRVGAGTGAMVGKIRGREFASDGGLGFAAELTGGGRVVAALAVVNAMGDVVAGNGSVLAGPRREDGSLLRTVEEIAALERMPQWTETAGENTTLACVMTDARLDAAQCAVVARMASAGIARAVDPVFTPVDGDVAFCIASGEGAPGDRFEVIAVGALGATLVAEAIRRAVS